MHPEEWAEHLPDEDPRTSCDINDFRDSTKVVIFIPIVKLKVDEQKIWVFDECVIFELIVVGSLVILGYE